MKVRFLRTVSMALASLAISSVAVAAMDMDSRVTQLEKEMKQVHTETAIGTYGAETATARAEVKGNGAFVELDILCWHFRDPQAAYASTDSVQVGIFPIEGEVKNVDFGWDWGFRVGLGYNFEHDNWDLGARYTYFKTNSSESESALTVLPTQASGLVPDMRPGKQDWSAEFDNCTKASTSVDFTYQTLDVDLGRAFFVSKMLSFHPFWGVKTAWIKGYQTTSYTGGDPEEFKAGKVQGVEVLGLQSNVIKVKIDDHYWGIGPRVGCDSKWHLGSGFSIDGDVAAALLYGFNKDRTKESYSLYDQNGSDFYDMKNNVRVVTPLIEMKLGIRYDTYVNHDKQHFGVGFGYDTQYWWDAPIMLYGFTLDFRFDW